MLGNLPKLEPKSRPRPTAERRRPATWQKEPALLDDPSDSASTLTRKDAAVLLQTLCSARGIAATRFPGSSPSPVTARSSPSLANIFGAAAASARPMVTPVKLEDRFTVVAAGADATLT